MACIICNSEKEIKKFRYLGTDFFQCSVCGLIRTLPFPTEAQIEEHYRGKFADGNYNTLRSNMESYRAVYESYIELLRKKRGTLKGQTVLDIGCFTGDFLDLAKREGAETYGIELQKDAFEIANKKHDGRILNCSFEKAFFQKKFDIITMFGVIEHLTHPEKLIKMATDSLSDGGMIIIQTPNSGSLFAGIMGRYWPPYAPIEHIHYFSSRNIRMLLIKNHFINIEIKPHYKKLTANYVFGMLQNYGAEFRPLLSPVFKLLQWTMKSRKLLFYIGEMLVTAEKKSAVNG